MLKNRIFAVIVTVFLAAALAAGVHAFLIARSQKASNPCISHLRQIVAAKEQWAMENNKTTNDIPTWSDILPNLHKSQMPVCPQGGTYTIGRIGEPPTCSIGGPEHTLPKGEGQ